MAHQHMEVTLMRTLPIILAGVLCAIGFAEDKAPAKKAPAASAAPAMPKPGPEMKELRDLIGSWTTDEKFEQTPFMPAGTGAGVNTTRLGPGGFSVIMDQRSKGSMGSFTGHGRFAWD